MCTYATRDRICVRPESSHTKAPGRGRNEGHEWLFVIYLKAEGWSATFAGCGISGETKTQGCRHERAEACCGQQVSQAATLTIESTAPSCVHIRWWTSNNVRNRNFTVIIHILIISVFLTDVYGVLASKKNDNNPGIPNILLFFVPPKKNCRNSWKKIPSI